MIIKVWPEQRSSMPSDQPIHNGMPGRIAISRTVTSPIASFARQRAWPWKRPTSLSQRIPPVFIMKSRIFQIPQRFFFAEKRTRSYPSRLCHIICIMWHPSSRKNKKGSVPRRFPSSGYMLLGAEKQQIKHSAEKTGGLVCFLCKNDGNFDFLSVSSCGFGRNKLE